MCFGPRFARRQAPNAGVAGLNGKGKSIGRGCALVLLIFGAAGSVFAVSVESPGQSGAAIRLANCTGGETLRYPVALLRGTLSDASAPGVTLVNTSSRRGTREMAGLAHQGRFKVLAELVPGENKLVVRSGEAELPFTLHYKPQTNSCVVRVIYFTDRSGKTDYQTPVENDRQHFRGKLDTAMKLLQTFTAESLHDQGLGRATFNLELDDEGKVKVHVLQGDLSIEQYHRMSGGELYGHIAGKLGTKLPHKTATNLVIPAFTRFDPQTKKVYAHTALGGGNLALFGGGDLFAWPNSLADAQKAFMDPTPVDPNKLFSDSVGRHTFWANASTTIGAALHELGHTFGLPHSSDAHDIMTRGIDRLNRFFTFVEPPHAGSKEPYEFKDDEVACWSPVSAGALAPNRFFALDGRRWSDEDRSGVSLDAANRAVIVESDYGVRYIGVNIYGKDFGTAAVYPQFICVEKAPPKKVVVPIAHLGRKMATASVSIHVLDDQGHSRWVTMEQLLDGPFVQAWQFANVTKPWPNAAKFPDVDGKALGEIVRSASAARLVRSRQPFVDFLALAPSQSKELVAAYAVRTLRAESARKVRIITGSDDALRLWLNGKRIREVLALRGATPNAEATEAEVKQGENVLVAEVSQAGGGWGLFLRLEDDKGTRLELKEDGQLAPVDQAVADQFQRLLLGPHIRRWQFAAITHPWSDKNAFVPLDASGIEAIGKSAAAAKLVGDDKAAFVDFAPHFPGDRRANTAGYAYRLIRSDKPRTVKLFTGSDDALRVWLNGKLITEVLALRGTKADSEVTVASLQKGENRLLVEVSNAGGGWGLVLRIEDADGADLMLTDDGKLIPFL